MRPPFRDGDPVKVRSERDRTMAIKVILHFQTHPGRRDELKRWLDGIVAEHGPQMVGFLGSRRFEVLDDPDVLIEIADWESAEARLAHLQAAAATGAFAPMMAMLAAPFRATVIQELP